MLELTTRSDLTCPSCGKIDIKTKGILGGLIQQLFLQSALKKLEQVGGTMTCNKCNISWDVEGKNEYKVA